MCFPVLLPFCVQRYLIFMRFFVFKILIATLKKFKTDQTCVAYKYAPARFDDLDLDARSQQRQKKNQRWMLSATKQAINIELATTVDHFLRDKHVYMAWQPCFRSFVNVFSNSARFLCSTLFNLHATPPKTECGFPSGGGIKNGQHTLPLLWRNAERKTENLHAVVCCCFFVLVKLSRVMHSERKLSHLDQVQKKTTYLASFPVVVWISGNGGEPQKHTHKTG